MAGTDQGHGPEIEGRNASLDIRPLPVERLAAERARDMRLAERSAEVERKAADRASLEIQDQTGLALERGPIVDPLLQPARHGEPVAGIAAEEHDRDHDGRKDPGSMLHPDSGNA